MRIVVSGTHCSGKSTLVSDFLAAHRDYTHEPEPWEWLVEVYNESLPEEPDGAGFHRQLEVSVERLRTYGRTAHLIAERCPLDFLAYILALDDLGRDRHAMQLVEPAVLRFEPDLVVVSAGFDAHVDDPLAGMRVTADGFHELASRSAELGPRVAAVLEGGYDPRTLPGLVAAALEGLSK